MPGFRLGIYVFKDAEIVDFAALHGVISVARRFDAELDAFLIMGLLDGLAATNRKEPDRAESRHRLGDGDGGGSASEERPNLPSCSCSSTCGASPDGDMGQV